MGLKLPWYILALLAGLLVVVGVNWFRERDAAREYFEQARAADKALADTLERRVIVDSARADTLRRLQADREELARDNRSLGLELAELQTKTEEAGHATDAASHTLEEHLVARDDTAGVRLLSDLEGAYDARSFAFRSVIANVENQNANLSSQLRLAENEILIMDTRLLARDSTIASLQDANERLREEAEKWYRQAHPGFWKKALKTAPYVVGGYALGRVTGSI